MSANFWSKVGVAMQSALATAVPITGITKANPGVVSHGGTDPSDGAYVLLLVQGMYQLNAKIARVTGAAAGSFSLEGIDTTDFDTFSSGTFQVITFGTTLATLTDVNASGGDPEFADTTTIHDAVRRQVPVVTSALSISFESLFDPSDAGLVALKAASDSIAQRAIKITFSTGPVVVFYGYVSATLIPTGTAQDVVKTPVTVTADGLPTVYSS